MTHVRSEHGVGLPHLIGVCLGEGQSALALACMLGLEQFVLFDQPAESRGRQPLAREQALFDADAVNGLLVDAPGMETGQDRVDGLLDLFGMHLARFALVRARRGFQRGDPVLVVAHQPGLDGTPGEGAHIALLVGEAHLADRFDAIALGFAFGHVDRAQHAHLQVLARVIHLLTPFATRGCAPWRSLCSGTQAGYGSYARGAERLIRLW